MNTYFLILVVLLLSFLVLRKTFVEGFDNSYWKTHSKEFLENCNLNFFNYTILNYNVKKENEFITNIIKKAPFNSIILDIGAYDGNTCIELSRKLYKYNRNDIKIIAFEPKKIYSDKINNVALKENLNLQCINIVVSNYKGTINKKKEEGAGTIYGKNYNSEKFNCDTLDNILKKYNIYKVYFMKIDVEGHEPEVLEGSKKILKKTDHLYIEMWSDKHYEIRTGNKNIEHNKNILQHLTSFYPIQKIEKNIYFKKIYTL